MRSSPGTVSPDAERHSQGGNRSPVPVKAPAGSDTDLPALARTLRQHLDNATPPTCAAERRFAEGLTALIDDLPDWWA